VHLQASTRLIDFNPEIGDGFAAFEEGRDLNKEYLSTTPPVCQTLGDKLFEDVTAELREDDQKAKDNIKAVELTQMWPFGLNYKDKFVGNFLVKFLFSSHNFY
jgi:hypothetical protein